jgi:hypothetical protein
MTLKKLKICYEMNNIETPQEQNSQMVDTAGLDRRHHMTSFWNNNSNKIFTRVSDNGFGRT